MSEPAATQPGTGSTVAVATQTKPSTGPAKPAQPRAWNVVLLDDDDHTYDYVIRMMQKLFRHTPERAYEIARTVDSQGRAVCFTTHRELAELKCEQVMGFGPDPQMARCAGAMSALIEPALGGDDGDDPADGRTRG